MFTFYHGTNNPNAIIEALMGSGRIRKPFHMAPDVNIARNYGRHVVKVTLETDIPSAKVGMINKEYNYNRAVGNGIEVVINNPSAEREFYHGIYDAVTIN